MGSRRTTIRDVARQAGVSITTVSKVINGRDGVAPATMRNVRAVAEELSYQPSLIASGLRRLHTNVIGILVADLDPFSAELLIGAARAVRYTPYELVVYLPTVQTRLIDGWERRLLSRLGGTLIDGAVLVAPSAVTAGIGVPVVAVDPRADDHHGGPGVTADTLDGGRQAVQHLIGLGHRRIGLVAGRPGLESTRDCRSAYETALLEGGIELDPTLIVTGDSQTEMSHRAALELLGRRTRPTAVFAASDMSAIGVLSAAATLGLHVPQDLSVVGFDNVAESVTTDPPLTTVKQPIRSLGASAVDTLLALMRGEEVPARAAFPTTLVVRGTTGPPAAGPRRAGPS